MKFSYALLLILVVFAAVAQTTVTLAPVNSSLDEQSPFLSPDGNTLFFTLASHPQNVGGQQDRGDIWFTTRTPNGWSAPVHGGKALNNTLHNTVAGMSADGKQLFLMGHYEQKGRPVTSQGLSVSTLTGDVWSAPKNIVIPYFKNLGYYQTGCLSADGQVLVFSADSYQTLGVEDVYVSVQSNGKWSEPKNLGPAINTSMQDVSPYLTDDGRRLYFATNGRSGFGSFDILYADRLDDTWQNWSAPVNAGPSINTEGRELFFRSFPSGDYYTSTKNSDGYGDIIFIPASVERPVVKPSDSVRVAVQEPPDSASTAIKEIVYEAPKEKERTRMYGKVTDSKSGSPVPRASIHFLSAANLEINSGSDGTYTASLPALNRYHIRVEAPGYIGEFEELDLRTQVMDELEMNFNLLPIAIGATINLRSVLFEQSKPILLPESFDELDMVADFMTTNPHIEIELAGHTDNRGKHDLNMKLSRERVAKVKEYLVSKGIAEKRITGKGYGGTKPIADNDVDETRKLNRRVEFTILKD